MKPEGCPHSDCARCNGTVAELEAKLEQQKAVVEAAKKWRAVRLEFLLGKGTELALDEAVIALVEALKEGEQGVL